MKYKGRKIAGSSLLTILGVVCFATVLVAAGTIAITQYTTPRNVVATPMTLTLQNVALGPDNWANGGDALVGVSYDQGLLAHSTWSGNFAITVTVSATTAFIAGDVTMSYTKDGGASTPMTFSVVSGSPDTLTCTLGTHSVTALVDINYVFTFTVNTAHNSVIIGFAAASV